MLADSPSPPSWDRDNPKVLRCLKAEEETAS